MRVLSLKLACILVLTTLALPQFAVAQAQNPATDVVMVLPFENTSNRAEYNWVGESFADALAELLNKPGLVVVSSDERELAYQRLRLPETVIPSRATAIKPYTPGFKEPASTWTSGPVPVILPLLPDHT